MRSLLPLGVDMAGLALDTAVAAYLLDPSTDHYRLGDLADTLPRGVGGRRHRCQGSGRVRPRRLRRTPRTGATDRRADEATGGAPGWPRSWPGSVRPWSPTRWRRWGRASSTTTSNSPWSGCWPAWRWWASRVDREVLRSIAAGLAEECRSLEATIQDLAGEPFKVNSVPQLRTVLYEKLGLTPVRKTKTGFSTDARTLELLRGQHPIIEALLRYREVEKLRSTYGESLAAEVAPDGRIHATFRQTVARTGRLSSDRPNLHNIPVRTEEGRRFRQAFVPVTGPSTAGGRLRPGGVAGHRPPVRGSRSHRGLRRRRGHPPHGGLPGVRRRARRRSPSPSVPRPRWSPTAWPTAWRPTGSPSAWPYRWRRPRASSRPSSPPFRRCTSTWTGRCPRPAAPGTPSPPSGAGGRCPI